MPDSYTLNIRRYDPESTESAHWQEFGVVAADVEGVAVGHQYLRSSGSHWVSVTSE